MIVRIETKALLDHPPAAVFATAADPLTQLRWDPVTLRGVEKINDGPLGLGARYRGAFKWLGSIDYEFVEYEPDRRFAHLARLPMGTLRHTFSFELAERGTEMTQTGELRPNLIGRIGRRIMARALRHRFETIAVEIDRYLSSREGPAS